MEQNNNNIDCKRLLSYIMSIAGDCRLMLSHVTSTEENEETTTDIKDLFRKSFENFDADIHAFENINNILNIALLHSNLCRGLELVENSSDLFENYRTLSWELLNGICVMIILLQDYAPLSTMSQEDVEKEVIECTTRALKYLEVELIVHYQIHRRHHQHHYQYYCELQQQHKYDNTRRPQGIITRDFNNDKYLDIAVAFSLSDKIGILLGYGNGSFGIMMTYSTGNGSRPQSLTVHDFNNDGQLDIVVISSATNDIGILLGYGNGSFTTSRRYSTGNGSGPIAIILTDINNDGEIDIVVANAAANNIGILLGHGNLTFDTIITYSTGNNSKPQSLAVGDFDNDGQIDIAVANFLTSNISIFLGYQNGNFTIQVSYSTGYQSWPHSITVGDFNRDNRLDIATCNFNMNDVSIFLGYGNGSFAPLMTFSTGDGSAPVFVEARDFNNDGILDIAVANYGTNTIVVLFGFGDGSFLPGIAYQTGVGSAPCTLTTGDFDNNSQLDIIVTNEQSNDISIFLAYDRELYGSITSYSMGFGSQPHSIAIGDLNNDGLSDIVVANYGTDNVGILLGHNHGVFDTIPTYSIGVGSSPYSVSIADFNNDNQLDIVVSNSESDNIVILLGDGNGMFVIRATYSTGTRSQPSTVAVGDFDNNKKLDIAIANSGTNSILLFYGYGNGLFGNQTSYDLGYGYRPYSIAIKDLNQDNWMDIAIACYGTDHVETLIKMC
ncbi:unnamed protein product [Rotaria sordida]|uniref:EDRF1 TPR repeats region domain-containing protein n=1 Tax=Rotaria sordida TaxID=392033 RepID=A0A814S7E7_9BILA|nr:unnamed protein product [Rotaria sordida]